MNIWGLIVFSIAALTDYLDGQVARRAKQVTELGIVLDPFSDRILIAATGTAVFFRSELPLWSLVVLLTREILIMAGFSYLRFKKIKLSVSWVGKIATTGLMVSIFVLLVNLVSRQPALFLTGRTLFYLGLSLYIIAAFDYLKKGIALVRSK